MTVAAVLIATDALDDGTPVALLAWDNGRTLVEYQVDQLREAGAEVIEVVAGPGAERIISLISADNVEPLVSPRAQDDAATLRSGASAVPRDTETAVVMRVSEPRPASLLRALLDEHRRSGASATLPSFEGTPGRPAILGRDALAFARNVTASGDAVTAVVERFDPHLAAVEASIALLRIRRAADYTAVRRALVGR